jgi:hypothetical protein
MTTLLSVSGFIDFLEEQDPNDTINHFDSETCALGLYVQSLLPDTSWDERDQVYTAILKALPEEIEENLNYSNSANEYYPTFGVLLSEIKKAIKDK